MLLTNTVLTHCCKQITNKYIIN